MSFFAVLELFALLAVFLCIGLLLYSFRLAVQSFSPNPSEPSGIDSQKVSERMPL